MALYQRGSKLKASKKSDDNKAGRERVGKACDRCRLRKSKCDGLQPCERCQTDNGICVYGERKKPKEHTYPKGYTDQLVADQARLVKCVHILYRQCTEGNTQWDYPEIEIHDGGGGYLTHDILKSLGLIVPSAIDAGGEEIFDDNPENSMKSMVPKKLGERRQGEALEQQATSLIITDHPIQTPRASWLRTLSSSSTHHPGNHLTLEKSLITPLFTQSRSTNDDWEYQLYDDSQILPTSTGGSWKEGANRELFEDPQHSTKMLTKTALMPSSQLYIPDPVQPSEIRSLVDGQSKVAATYQNHNQIYGQSSPLPSIQYTAAPRFGLQTNAMEEPIMTLARSLESPSFATSGLPTQLPDQQCIWTSSPLLPDYDPAMAIFSDEA